MLQSRYDEHAVMPGGFVAWCRRVAGRPLFHNFILGIILANAVLPYCNTIYIKAHQIDMRLGPHPRRFARPLLRYSSRQVLRQDAMFGSPSAKEKPGTISLHVMQCPNLSWSD